MAEPTDIFPATSATWLESQVRCADGPSRERVRRHVMAIYFHPLVVYVKGSSYRTIGDADDLVAGFFADRLERGDYLEKWLVSGAPLRAWLIRGVRYFCMERLRLERRAEALPIPDEARDEIGAGPGTAFRREVARNLVREAVEFTGTELEAAGMGEHWHVFRMHHLAGKPFAVIAGAKGITEERAAVMARTAGRRLRARLREMCAWPGASEEEIDREIMSLFA